MVVAKVFIVSFGISGRLHGVRRFTNPADIPLGEGKSKIRALKARV